MSTGRLPSVDGGIQPTIVDAKGDLIAATAADTVSRLAVGANNTVLTADSSTATGLKWAAVSSKVVQYVYANSSAQTSSTSATYANTGLTASITPTSASNKILVFATHNGCAKVNNSALEVRLLRDATQIAFSGYNVGYTNTTTQNFVSAITFILEDNPATTSLVTYKTQLKNVLAVGTVYVDYDNAQSGIILVEVAP